MKYLLDVNVLLAAIWTQHPDHAKAKTWLGQKDLVLCPSPSLGFFVSAHIAGLLILR
jgi:predicted nucleic acid-binding protein